MSLAELNGCLQLERRDAGDVHLDRRDGRPASARRGRDRGGGPARGGQRAAAIGEAQAYAQEPAAEREDAPTQAFSYDQAAAAGYDLPFDAHGGAAAQAAAAPAPEPRRAAVVKPRGRDLFGEGGGGDGDEVQTSAPSMGQALPMARAAEQHEASTSAATGVRNENPGLSRWRR